MHFIAHYHLLPPSCSPNSRLPSSNKDGITSNQRILDPRRGPVNRAAGVRSLPRVEDREEPQRPAAQSDSPAAEKRSGRAQSLPKMEPAGQGRDKRQPGKK